jgi:glycosyltransferase involved in cell wall biosynthesis
VTSVARVVALVPAKDRADSVGATVRALRGLPHIERVLVVDDGSTDRTTAEALAAGAEVLRLPTNRGKSGAVAAGVAACPDADVFLLIDADLGASAAVADRPLVPVLADQADLVVGVLSAPRRGGLGSVRRLAAAGIHRAGGITVAAPLSGQRAVRAELLRDLESVERFGLEVAMTIDAARAGARLAEVEVPMTHRATGWAPAASRTAAARVWTWSKRCGPG